jgi:hypothetical protein
MAHLNRSAKMGKWWHRTPADLWVDLLYREKTRWIAVVIFIAVTLFANWAAFSGAISGEVLSRSGRPVNAQQQPVMYTLWLSWRTLLAVALDAILVWALISVWREKRIRPNKPPEAMAVRCPPSNQSPPPAMPHL